MQSEEEVRILMNYIHNKKFYLHIVGIQTGMSKVEMSKLWEINYVQLLVQDTV
jgi:hypothetical protein